MKLLIVTQKVNKNDPILGFFHRWIEEFSKHVEKLTVICLEEGEHDLPRNVTVLSLGKERHVSKLTYVARFYRYIWTKRNDYDVIFVHMNPIYVILGGLSWKILGKKIGLWYTHKNVDIKLRLAEKLSDVVFSASKESFRLQSSKLNVMGHGIDSSIFYPNDFVSRDEKVIVTSGRISPTKNIRMMLEAFAVMSFKEAKFVIIGNPSSEREVEYKNELNDLVNRLGIQARVEFVGNKSQMEVANILRSANIFINLSATGSLDKAVLEAMASGVYTISSNEAFQDSVDLFLAENDKDSLGSAMDVALKEDMKGAKREYIETVHNLSALIVRILEKYE